MKQEEAFEKSPFACFESQDRLDDIHFQLDNESKEENGDQNQTEHRLSDGQDSDEPLGQTAAYEAKSTKREQEEKKWHRAE